MLYSKEKLLYNQIFQSGRATAPVLLLRQLYGFAIFAVPGWVCDFAS